MSIELDLQLAVENEHGLPSEAEFALWLTRKPSHRFRHKLR